jgi:LmbE family N-acetylglucosaminyl deacetylase
LAARILAVSPHLDDAILSLGATLAHHRRNGGEVTVLTVFAGDPTSTRPAEAWDGRAGFATAGESSAVRRREDRLACEVLGVTPVHLDGKDEQQPGGRDDEGIAAAMHDIAGRHDELLVPGYPLWHPDHEFVTRLALDRLQEGIRLRLYAEEPYTAWALRGTSQPSPESAPLHGSTTWGGLPVDRRDHVSKIRAAGQYGTQLPLLATSASRGPLGGPATSLLGLLWHEGQVRGELVSDLLQV